MWDWLSIVVIVAIVLVVVDGLRRKFREKNALKMKLDNSLSSAVDPDDELTPELPSGGARTIPRNADHSLRRPRDGDRREKHERIEPDFGDVLAEDDTADEPWMEEADGAADEPVHGAVAEAHWPEQGGDVPADPLAGYDDAEDAATEPDSTDDTDEDERPVQSGVMTEPDDNAHEMAEPEDDTEEQTAAASPATEDRFPEEEDMPLMADSQDAPVASRRRPRKKSQRSFSERFFRHTSVQNELPLDDEDTAAEPEEDHSDAGETDEVEEVIIINVMAPAGQPFDGSQLLQILLRQGMRLGHMSIFHRHADNNGSGPVMFSLANMVKPGTFDMAAMDSFTTPGVSLFTQLPSKLPHMRNFELMLETAQCLRDELAGELKDENRSDLTRQTIEHYRQRIQDFELHRLARK